MNQTGSDRPSPRDAHRVLYSYWRSSTAYRARIALHHKGLAYRQSTVSLVRRENLECDYRSVNPQMLVPLLDDDGTRVPQSMAIMEYLEERYPKRPLLPGNFAERAYLRSVANAIACEIHPLNNVRVLNYLVADLGLTEDQRSRWYGHWIQVGLQAVEHMVRQAGRYGQYCLGDQVSIADFCLLPQLYNAERFACRLDDYPLLVDIAQRCSRLSAFARAHPLLQPDALLPGNGAKARDRESKVDMFLSPTEENEVITDE